MVKKCSMSVAIRKMTSDEFEAFYREGIELLTQELMQELHLTYEDANKEAIEEFSSVLPHGFRTENNFPMAIVEENSGETVGFICVLHKGENDKKMSYIYNLSICEAKRRKGYATESLKLVENEAVEVGCLVSILFVKDSNKGARALYHKCGYQDFRQDGYGRYMLKELQSL